MNRKMEKSDGGQMKLEAEDDNGRIVQVSGGFGDSNSMDPETMRILKENQERADLLMAKI